MVGSHENREEIILELRGGGHSTSTQVQREWLRIIMEVATKLREALKTARDRQDVVNQMTRANFSVRMATRRWAITEYLMGIDHDLEAVDMRLAQFLRIGARAAFRTDIGTIRDGTECGVVLRRPYIKKGQWKYDDQCKKTEDICRQPNFFDENRERALAAAGALEGSGDDGHRSMGKKVRETLERDEARATKGKACHGNPGLGGDVCVALECGPGEILLTTDKSFTHICPAIDREYRLIAA